MVPDVIRLWPKKRITPVQQMEAAECGVACVTMLLQYHGHHAALTEVRELCGTSRDGNSAADLLRGARKLGLVGRGLSVPLARLPSLQKPAILHWDMNHFVILESIAKDHIGIVDPASGRRKVSHAEVDRFFSGVALELEPGPALERRRARSLSYERYVSALGRSKKTLAFVLLANITGQLLALSFPAASQILIDHVIAPQRDQWLVPVLAVLLFGAIGQLLLVKLQGGSQALLRGAVGLELTSELGRRLLSVPLPFLDSRSHGDLLARVQIQAELQALVARAAQAGFDALFVLLLGSLMLAYDLRLGLLALGMMLVRITALHHFRAASQQRVAAELAARGREKAALVEATLCAEMIKGLELEGGLVSRYEGRVRERAGFGIRNGQLQRALSSSLSVLGGLMEAGILWFGGLSVVSGDMSIGVFSGFLAIRAMVEAPLGSLVALFESWARFRGALERSDDVLSVPVVGCGTAPAEAVTGRLEARNLGFRYGSGGKWVLRNISFVIEPQERVAFVGPSGHGKSTLAKLLVGLLEPSEGEVLLDGVAIAAYERSSLARQLGVVLQDPLILAGSAREALSLRHPDAAPAELQQAAKIACFEPVLRGLPGGYDGAVEPLGANLSGGERQRLALAQALVGEPRLLMLDEATCALDPTTERQLLDNLDRVPATIVSVAHRPSVVERAQRVFAVLDGSVNEVPRDSVIPPRIGEMAQPTWNVRSATP